MLAEASGHIFLSSAGHGQEHSLEVQIPFLQTVLNDFDIIPIVIGDQSKNNIKELADAIADVFSNEKILIVASTDLSHYHPYGLAVDLDSSVEKYISDFDVEGLHR
jgi:MEMO1 family protein